MIIARTPFRVSFFGGGTDYPAWYMEHGGSVLSCAIDKYCYVSARWLPPFFEHRHRIVWSKVELVEFSDKIEHPAVRAALQYLNLQKGLEIHHQADLPARTGLGSSSAFTVALLHALHALNGLAAGARALAMQAIHIERELMRETVGIQDQIACAYGGLNRLEIAPGGEWQSMPVVIGRNRRRDLENHLLLYYTGISRHASAIAEAQVAEMPKREGAMRDLAALVPEALSVLEEGGALQDFGRLLDESWRIKRSLSPLISNPDIDALYTRARAHGAIGGKLLGAGGGGFLLLLARPEDQGQLRRALSQVLEVPFGLDAGGSRIIYAEG